MRSRSLSLVFWGIGQLYLLGPEDLRGVEIYRFGSAGERLAETPDTRFHHIPWSSFVEKAGLDEGSLAAGVLRPRLLSLDENIALTSVERGGGPYVPGNVGYYLSEVSKTMVDGDPSSAYEWVATAVSSSYSTTAFIQQRVLSLDLGGFFNISRVRLFTSESGLYPDRLDIAALGGLEVRARAGFHNDNIVFRVRENVEDTIDVSFPSTLARNVGLRLYRISPKAVKVAEVEVYGEGYITRGTYVGPFIELDEPAIWGALRWRGVEEAGASVFIRSRSGGDREPNVYWRFTGRGDERTRFNEEGQLLDAAAYARLKPGEAAAISYDTENWSFWSAPYDFADSSSAAVASPSPQSVLQLRVDFAPGAQAAGEVEFIEISATKPPLAQEVVGEIFPPEVELGETAQFSLSIEPTIRAKHSGFDRIQISTPFGVAGVDTVKIGGRPVPFEYFIEGPDSTLFSVQLPRLLQAGDSGELLAVVFRAPALRYGTAFSAWVRNTERPLELAQPINPGDADRSLSSESLTVRTTFSNHLLAGFKVQPTTATPNGDGLNDAIKFSFELLQLTDVVFMQVEIFDVSGRLVRVLHRGGVSVGTFQFSWDGRDASRALVPPGLYLYRVLVEAEEGQDTRTGALAVVY